MSSTVTTVAVSPRLGRIAEATQCLFFYLGLQATGDLRDYRDARGNAPKNAGFSDGAAWANEGFATSGAGGAAEFFERPAGAGHSFTLAGRVFCVSIRIKRTAPGSNEIVAGSYTSGSPGGFRITVNSTGSVSLTINAADNTSAAFTITSTYTPADGNEHTLTWFIPPDAVNARFFVDGLPASSASAAAVAGKDCRNEANPMRIGSDLATAAGKLLQFGSFQAYNPVAATLASIPYDDIAMMLHNNPYVPVPDWVWYPVA